MARDQKNKSQKNKLYGGLTAVSPITPTGLSTSYTPTYIAPTTYTYPAVASYDPYVYSVPSGINYLIKKSLTNPAVPYYPDASVSVTDYDNISTIISSEDEYGNVKNTIITEPLWTNPYDPLITSWHPDYIHPMLSTYRDLNSDPKMKKKITKYFLTLVLDKWLRKDMNQILNYLQIDSAGNVDFVKNLGSINTATKDSSRDADVKVRFLERYLINYEFINKMLLRYMRENGVLWVNLPAHKHEIKRFLMRKIIKKIKNAVENINRRA
jgi:hypothetical protein